MVTTPKLPPERIPRVLVQWDQCRGCRLCELVCARFHYGVINPELSRIRVYTFYPGPMSIPITCSYCSDHPCVEACPTGALYYNEETRCLDVNKEKCLGMRCKLCARACKTERSNSIHFHPPEHNYPMVCDLCRGDPQCVKVCPFDVLKFTTLRVEGRHFADPAEVIAEDLAEKWYPAKAKKRVEWTL